MSKLLITIYKVLQPLLTNLYCHLVTMDMSGKEKIDSNVFATF